MRKLYTIMFFTILILLAGTVIFLILYYVADQKKG